MIYTGLEKHTEQELARMAYGSSNRVAIELAKRLEARTGGSTPHTAYASYEEERAALRGAGVNPIPINTGDEE